MSVQLKRTDLVRIAAERLREQIADDIRVSTDFELKARLAFQQAMRNQAIDCHREALAGACRIAGSHLDRIRVDVLLEMTDDVIANPPATVAVVIRDGEEWNCRLSLRADLPVNELALAYWVKCVKAKTEAETRGTRAKDLDAAARAKMIDDLLTTHATGRRVLEALSAFLAEMKESGS